MSGSARHISIDGGQEVEEVEKVSEASVWKDRSITMGMYAWGDKKLIIWREGRRDDDGRSAYLCTGRRQSTCYTAYRMSRNTLMASEFARIPPYISLTTRLQRYVARWKILHVVKRLKKRKLLV